jgi:hypothetical protein
MSQKIQSRLLDGAIDDLTHLAFDHLLSQPFNTLFNADSIAHQITAAFKQISNSQKTEDWLRCHVQALQEQRPSGSLRDHVPADVVDPIKSAIQKPITPNRMMVGRLVEHGAVESLLRELLVSALQGFAGRLKPSMPGAERTSSRLRSLKRVSEGMLGGLGAEIERQAEQKAKDFVDSILASVITQAADDLCDPKKAESYGRFRAHIFEQLLDTPLDELNKEIQKLDPETWVSTSSAMAKALSERPNMESEIKEIIEFVLSNIGEKTAAEVLDEAGIEDSWRQQAEMQCSTVARGFVKSDAFGTWLEQLLKD